MLRHSEREGEECCQMIPPRVKLSIDSQYTENNMIHGPTTVTSDINTRTRENHLGLAFHPSLRGELGSRPQLYAIVLQKRATSGKQADVFNTLI